MLMVIAALNRRSDHDTCALIVCQLELRQQRKQLRVYPAQ